MHISIPNTRFLYRFCNNQNSILFEPPKYLQSIRHFVLKRRPISKILHPISNYTQTIHKNYRKINKLGYPSSKVTKYTRGFLRLKDWRNRDEVVVASRIRGFDVKRASTRVSTRVRGSAIGTSSAMTFFWPVWPHAHFSRCIMAAASRPSALPSSLPRWNSVDQPDYVSLFLFPRFARSLAFALSFLHRLLPLLGLFVSPCSHPYYPTYNRTCCQSEKEDEARMKRRKEDRERGKNTDGFRFVLLWCLYASWSAVSTLSTVHIEITVPRTETSRSSRTTTENRACIRLLTPT